MRKLHYLLLLIVLTTVTTYSLQTASADSVPVVHIENEAIHIHWQTPTIQWVAAEDGAVVADIAAFEQTNEAGQPVVPVSSILVALPMGAEPTVSITQLVQSQEPLAYRLPIAPIPQGVVTNQLGEVAGGDYVSAPTPTQFDPVPYRFEEVGTVRGARLARVSFFPVQVDAADSVSVISELSVEISFNAASGMVLSDKTAVSNPLTSSLIDLVVNPQHLTERAPTPPQLTLNSVDAAAGSVAIEVEETGITALTYADLTAAGFTLGGVNPAKLQLWQDGNMVDMEWDGDGDAQFEAGERLLFFANPAFSRWSNHDTYILTVESGNGTRISTAATSTSGLNSGRRFATAVLEENQIYSPNCYCGKLPVARDGDRWMWDDLRQPGRPENSYQFDLLPVDSSEPAELTAWFMGFTSFNTQDPDHRVDVSVNGSQLGSVLWDARTAVTDTLPIPAALLQTSNELHLNLPGLPNVALDGVWFDAAQVRYVLGNGSVGTAVQFAGESTAHRYSTQLTSSTGVRVFDVTDPAAPTKLSNLSISGASVSFGDVGSGSRRYAIANGAGVLSPTAVRVVQPLLTQTASAADYVIVSHPDFIDALAPLVSWREAQGLTVVVEDVLRIYDAYGNGRPSPDAIQAYLANAYSTLSPTYVLLVGDATIDPKNYKDNSSDTYVLPYLSESDPWIGEVPTDNRYVTVDGDDILPDMLIGRFSVNSAAETAVVVNKTINYEKSPTAGDWNQTFTFVADDQDSAGDFANHSNDLIDLHIPAPFATNRMYYEPATTTVADFVTDVRQMWNQGSGLVVYNGHSSTHQWGGERYFHLDDVSALTNKGRLPVVLQMTCLTGSFQRPDFETIDEALLRHENGGAVAVWGSTGLGVATGHELLASAYLDSILERDEPLGAAALAGKLNVMLNAPSNDEIVDTYTLFGDPALAFNTELVPNPDIFLPLITNN